MSLRPAEYSIYVCTPNTKQLRKAFHHSEESQKTATLKSASYKPRCCKLAIQIKFTDWVLEYGRYKLYKMI